MKDERKMKIQRTVLAAVTVGVMFIDIYVLRMAFELGRHIALCGLIMLLTGIVLVYDSKLKEKSAFIMHSIWMGLWITNLILHLS